MRTPDDVFCFAEDESGDVLSSKDLNCWRIMIVDDDHDVHEASEFALRGLQILGRSLEFIHTYSAAETLAYLRQDHDVAVILLDVVMETEDAGLSIVATIREALGLTDVRIILRTGQPGYAPEMEAIHLYEINDYKTKNELTRIKLFTSLTTAIRSYDQLTRLQASRRGLMQILDASQAFMSAGGLSEFATGVLTQITKILGVMPDGVVCTGFTVQDSENSHIIGAMGKYAQYLNQPLKQLGDNRIQDRIVSSIKQRRSTIDDQSVILFCPGRSGNDFIIFIDSNCPLCETDRNLVELFCTNIGLCGDNISLISRLREMATVDNLVKLPNRLAFIAAIDQVLASHAVENQVIAILEIDRFAEINDVLGSAYGDLLLIAIARHFQQQLSAAVVIARISGCGFAVLGSEDRVHPQALQSLCQAPLVLNGIETMVSFSMGLVRLRDFKSSGTELFQCASIALKRAKGDGQIGQVAYYTPEVRDEIRYSAIILHQLGLALQGDKSQFYLVYQPQIDLATNKVIGLEALIRWKKPDGTIVPPDRFIPIAEQSGLVVPLGEWVLQTALAALQRLHVEGYVEICMAVNVSVVQFAHPGFINCVASSLQNCAIDAERLELEITESAAAIGLESMQNILRQLKAKRITIAIDDFGTGYSSLSYLDQLSADRLKIDRAFISLIGSEQPGVRITEMVVPLGRHLGMKVLAEGVENEIQVKYLRQLGCDEIQGYFSGRPMDLEALLVWLEQHNGYAYYSL